MIHLPDLVNGMAQTLAQIPDLMAQLALDQPIRAYIDMNPVANSVEKATYQLEPGQLLVIWTGTRLERGTMSKWSHVVEILLRALPDQSILDLIDSILAGVPYPGDGMVWRNCPLLAGLLPTEVIAIGRRTDTEGVDYGVIETETAETGDWPNP